MTGNFTYSNPKVIHWGRGSIEQLGGELERLKMPRVLLVTTRSLVAEGVQIETVRQSMGPSVVAATVTVTQHSPLGDVDAAESKAADSAVDGIVSFGGGSAIDSAKLVAFRIAERAGHHRRTLPHLAIPTTLSAAELAGGAGFTNEAGDKAGVRDPRLLADSVIYDAELTLSTPMQLWLSTGVRALDHAIEGFLAPGDHPFNDVLAMSAIRLLFDSLPRAQESPDDPDIRTENQLAAWFSFTLPGESASGLSHMMGKQIGARHGIPHGVTSCLLLPHVMRYVERGRPDRVAALSAATGADPPSRVEDLIRSLGLPHRIAAYGVTEAQLARAASELAGKYPESDLREIYLAAL